MPDNKTVEQQTTNHFPQRAAQMQQTQPGRASAPDCQHIQPAPTQAAQSQPYQNKQYQNMQYQTEQYQNELQQQRLRNLAAELNAMTDPNEKMQFIENRLLENLQHLKRQLAILQQGMDGSAGDTRD